MQKYQLEFILHTFNTPLSKVKSSLSEFGEGLKLSPADSCLNADAVKDIKINMNTNDPELIFDICSQFGRIKTVKIDEVDKIRE